MLDKDAKELALIYSSIAQTHQDLENIEEALVYYNLELKCVEGNYDLVIYAFNELFNTIKIYFSNKECKALLDIVEVKEKLRTNFDELNEIYQEALYKAQQSKDLELQVILKYA